MTKDEIIKMAQEAGLSEPKYTRNYWTSSGDELVRFAALVAAAERDECAKVAAGYAVQVGDVAQSIESAIRAGGAT